MRAPLTPPLGHMSASSAPTHLASLQQTTLSWPCLVFSRKHTRCWSVDLRSVSCRSCQPATQHSSKRPPYARPSSAQPGKDQSLVTRTPDAHLSRPSCIAWQWSPEGVRLNHAVRDTAAKRMHEGRELGCLPHLHTHKHTRRPSFWTGSSVRVTPGHTSRLALARRQPGGPWSWSAWRRGASRRV